MHKALSRQLRRCIGIEDASQLAVALKDSNPQLIAGLAELLERFPAAIEGAA